MRTNYNQINIVLFFRKYLFRMKRNLEFFKDKFCTWTLIVMADDFDSSQTQFPNLSWIISFVLFSSRRRYYINKSPRKIFIKSFLFIKNQVENCSNTYYSKSYCHNCHLKLNCHVDRHRKTKKWKNWKFSDI